MSKRTVPAAKAAGFFVWRARNLETDATISQESWCVKPILTSFLLKVLTKTNKRGMLTAESRRTVSKEGRTMSFGEQLRKRREELGISRAELADRLGVSRSAIGNYETGVSAPKEEVLLRLFDALGVDPNYLYRDAYRANGGIRSDEELALLESYRRLSLAGRQTVHTMVRALEGMQQELEQAQPQQAPRTIPLYFSPAAAGYAAPVFSEDYETIPVTGQVPRGAELAVRIQGDSMEPHIHDGGVVYVNHDPLQNGDVGIFCVDGEMVCKQYYRDPLGMVYLFSLNRRRADADVLLPPSSGRSLTCFGRCMLHSLPLPQ